MDEGRELSALKGRHVRISTLSPQDVPVTGEVTGITRHFVALSARWATLTEPGPVRTRTVLIAWKSVSMIVFQDDEVSDG